MTKAIAKRPPTEPAATNEADAYLQLIERIVKDPSVDVAKVEKMLDLHERVRSQRAMMDFITALKALQNDLPQIARKGEITLGNKVQSRYGKWEDIDRIIRPLMDKHGFALSFKSAQNGHVSITARLSHIAGHAEETTVNLPTDTSGNKNAVQAVGSAISYGKRYAASMLLNLVFLGEDDDGVAAGQSSETIGKVPLGVLTKLLKESGADQARFLQHFGIEALEDLPDTKFAEAERLLKQRMARRS